MQRSSSGARVSEGDASACHHEGMALSTYDQQSATGWREDARAQVLEHAVHCIPLVLFLCAFLLWLSVASSPSTSDSVTVVGYPLGGDTISVTKDNKDLYTEEAISQREKQCQRMLSIPGLIAPNEFHDEMVDS